jgi:molybdopterin-biosynthesis enzyme MoeA-like protein
VESFTRAGVVLVTGGLGHTTDDITREIVAICMGWN